MRNNLAYTSNSISTHAPRTGSDARAHFQALPAQDFNPRSPHGERRSPPLFAPQRREFQPTLPARGATTVIDGVTGSISISTHAPRTGSDGVCDAGRTQHADISTHAPRTGSDRSRAQADRHHQISTHAPRTGSDDAQSVQESADDKFQPTLPARGATTMKIMHKVTITFQPTLPARGATFQQFKATFQGDPISTHAPRTGSDPTDVNTGFLSRYFNPRSPHGERPRWTRCFPTNTVFQPTLPARGATVGR